MTTGIDALQHTLAAEHAAVFVFAALGGRASALPPSPMRSALDAAYVVHLERREQLRTMITADAERRWAVDALVSTAVGEAAFGGSPEALPGLGTA